jgi:hypothetical protein
MTDAKKGRTTTGALVPLEDERFYIYVSHQGVDKKELILSGDAVSSGTSA